MKYGNDEILWNPSSDFVKKADISHFMEKYHIRVLEQCSKAGKNILISTPKDIGHQDGGFGNKYETHKFQWERKHFDHFPQKTFIPDQGLLICYIGEKADLIERKTKSRNRKEFQWRIREIFPFLVYPYRILRSIRK
jgi:hypothetical protein|tara:strand:- start:40925 stop:41335 length:411 start_codon:yes stop_codon:yes gene_type:complete